MYKNLLTSKKIFAVCLASALTSSCATHQPGLVILLPQDSAPTGEVEVFTNKQSAKMDQPWQIVRLSKRGGVKLNTIDEEETGKIFGDALAALPPAPISLFLYFEFGSTELSGESDYLLNELFSIIAERDVVEVQITGHTDTFGPDKVNDTLSLERAMLMRDLLVSRGLVVSSIKITGRGERQLLVQTDDEVSEPLNRRVEVIIR